MDERHREILKKYWVKIIDDVEPTGEVLDYLYGESILTDNDCEKIKSCKTRNERCQSFLIILKKRGPQAFDAFLTALAKYYPHIHESISNETGVYKTSENGKMCTKCRRFFPDRITSQFVRSLLDRHCCDLFNNIDPIDIIDFLYRGRILEDDDYERIKSCITSRDKCKCLFQALNDCPKKIVPCVFMQSLEQNYGYIVRKIEKTVESVSGHCVNDNNNNCSEIGNIKCCDSSGMDKSLTYVKTYADSSSDIEHNIVSNRPTNRNMKKTGVNNEQRIDLQWDTLGSSLYSNVTNRSTNRNMKEKTVNIYEQRIDLQGSRLGSSLYSCNKTMDIDTPLDNVLFEPKESRNYSEISFAKELSLSVLSTDNENFDTENDTRRKRRKGDHTMRKEPDGKSFQTSFVLKFHSRAFLVDPGKMPNFQFPSRLLTMKFEQLIQLIYQGDYLEFEKEALQLWAKYQDNPDMCCMLAFLQASRCLFEKDLDKVKKCLKQARNLISRTSNPKYFEVELQSALVRLNLSEKNFGKVEKNLQDGMMMIKADPIGCRGRAAGWLHFFDSRYKTTCMTVINPQSCNSIPQYEMYLKQASESNQIALQQFQEDGGIDSQIGLGYTLIRSAMLLLKCGDNGCAMDVLQPSEDEIARSKNYLDALENLNVQIKKKFLEVHFLLAKCDYFYRLNNIIRALEYAESAHVLALEMNLQPYTGDAYSKLCHIRQMCID